MKTHGIFEIFTGNPDYHGLGNDPAPFACSQLMVDAARRSDADVELIAYDRVGYGSWNRAYRETDLIEWQAAQQRTPIS